MSHISNSKAVWTIVFEVLNILPGSSPFSNEDKPIRSMFIERITCKQFQRQFRIGIKLITIGGNETRGSLLCTGKNSIHVFIFLESTSVQWFW